MAPRWLAVLGLLCVLACTAHSAALSTEDTLVVARHEDEATAPQQPSSTTEEPTTDEPDPPIKMTEMEVESVIALRYARTAVVARVRNPARRAQEAAFRVLLPDTAFITGFTMTLDGKSYKAYVKEKEEAKQIYNEAIEQGVGAAHIATKARDSNHFTVSVNVEGNSTAVFNLTYEELLVRRDQVYTHAVNLHPGAPVPRLAVTVRVRETARLRGLRVPPVRTGNEVDAGDDSAQNPIATVQRSEDGREAVITFKPDLEEQRRLSEIYAAKSKESQSQSRYGYGYRQQTESDQEGVLGQFVVQYDVERPEHGEVLVNDGYFVHFFAPSELPPLNKHAVFVLDTSGSMMGRKIDQLQEAMRIILSELNQGDYFGIVEFNSFTKVHDLNRVENVSEQPRRFYPYTAPENPTLLPPALATPENIVKAKKIIDALYASGGTNIEAALNVALNLVKKGVDWTPSTTPAVAGLVEVDKTTTEETKNNATPKEAQGGDQDRAVTTQNEQKELEPMIIFLTDGESNEGESRPDVLVKQVTEKNSSKKRASIFTLAFGEGADRSFLRKLSLRNEGFMRHIYEAADAALQLRAFYRQVASPLLAHVQFVYPTEQIEEGSLTQHKFRTLYRGAEAVVVGRLRDAPAKFAPVTRATGRHANYIKSAYEATPTVQRATSPLPLERLWAHLTIKQLLDQRDAADGAGEGSDSPAKKALALALKYEFVTPLTSLVVVKPNATSAVDAESVDKQGPLSLPGGGRGFSRHRYRSGSAPHYRTMARYPSYSSAYSSSISNNYGVSALLAPLPDRSYFMPQASYASDNRNIHSNGVFSLLASRGQHVRDFVRPASGYVPHASYPTAPVTTPVPVPVTSTSTERQSALTPYHLDEFPWVAELLRSNSTIAVPQKSIYLELTRDDQAPKTAGGDAACAPATDGAAGRCVYLTRCRPARTIAAAQYSDLHCVVDNRSVLQHYLKQAPKTAGGDAACAPATDGAGGRCVYLTRCRPARTIAAAQYSDLHCVVDNKYAGICCPEDKIDV